jgi:hypothetical protein
MGLIGNLKNGFNRRVALAFGWGFAEGSFFFMLPDVGLGWTALTSLREGAKQAMGCLAGAVLAGVILFQFGQRSPVASVAFVEKVPFVHPWMIDQARRDYETYGMWAPAIGPARGIPFKIYAILGPDYLSCIRFTAASIPSRLWRFALIVMLFNLASRFFRSRWPAHQKVMRWGYGIIWMIFYGLYWCLIAWPPY